jgi:hypothetical protein
MGPTGPAATFIPPDENAMHHQIFAKSVLLLSTLTLAAACASSAPQQDTTRSASLVEQSTTSSRGETMAAVHQENRAEIRGCFEGLDEAIEGAEIELRVPSSGEPSSIRLLDAEELPADLVACLEGVFDSLDYGPAEHGATYYQALTYDQGSGQLRIDRLVDAYERWGLSRDQIEPALFDRAESFEECYALALEPPTGRVLITVSIDSEGSVTRAGVTNSTLEAQPVEDCLVEAIFEIDFPKPRGGGVVVFDFPMRFNPEEGWLKEGVPGLK